MGVSPQWVLKEALLGRWFTRRASVGLRTTRGRGGEMGFYQPSSLTPHSDKTIQEKHFMDNVRAGGDVFCQGAVNQEGKQVTTRRSALR